MKIKLITAVSVLAFAAINNVNAADIVRHHEISTVIVKPVNTFSWSGLYIGAQGGYKWGKQKSDLSRTTTALTGLTKLDADVKGSAAGIFAGFNSNLENGTMFGLETDMFWNKLRGDHAYRTNGQSDTDASYVDNLGLTEKWSGATRLRLGFGSDRVLPYLAGGVAYARLSTDSTDYRDSTYKFIYAAKHNGGKTYVGWTAGAGVDYAATDNILVRLEYRYSDYGKKDFDVVRISGNADAPIVADRANVKYTTHDVRVGVAYKF